MRFDTLKARLQANTGHGPGLGTEPINPCNQEKKVLFMFLGVKAGHPYQTLGVPYTSYFLLGLFLVEIPHYVRDSSGNCNLSMFVFYTWLSHSPLVISDYA